MALKVKAVQTDLNHLSDANGNPLGMRFILKPELYSKLNDAKVIKEAALRSGVSKGVMQACWDAAGEVTMRGADTIMAEIIIAKIFFIVFYGFKLRIFHSCGYRLLARVPMFLTKPRGRF